MFLNFSHWTRLGTFEVFFIVVRVEIFIVKPLYIVIDRVKFSRRHSLVKSAIVFVDRVGAFLVDLLKFVQSHLQWPS